MQLQISHTKEKVPASKHGGHMVLETEKSSLLPFVQAAVAGERQRNLELDDRVREKMEHHFRLNFSGVRLVESDLPAKLGANAVAQGDLIRFAPGAFRPETTQGERLLSHELSHVVQQSRGGAMDGTAGLPFYDPKTEHSADAMAAQAMRGSLTAGSVRSFTPASAGQTPMLGDGFFSVILNAIKSLFCCNSSSEQEDKELEDKELEDKELEDKELGDEQHLLKSHLQQESSTEIDGGESFLHTEDTSSEPEKMEPEKQAREIELFPDGYTSLSSLEKEEHKCEVDDCEKAKEEVEENQGELFNSVSKRYDLTGDKKLDDTLEAINNAKSVEAAQKAFAAGTGHESIKGIIGGRDQNMLYLPSVQQSLCAMAHVIYNIPSLRGVISKFGGVSDPHTGVIMRTGHDIRPSDPTYCSIDVEWNTFREGENAAYMVGNTKADNIRRKNFFFDPSLAATREFDGAHEMGHVAAYRLSDLVIDKIQKNGGKNRKINNFNWKSLIFRKAGLVENFILQDAIAELYEETSNNMLKKQLETFIQKNQAFDNANQTASTAKQQKTGMAKMAKNLNFVYMEPDPNDKFFKIVSQYMDFNGYLKSTKSKSTLTELHLLGLTSQYGATSHKDLIAEAFADVYQNKSAANALSQKIYEIVIRLFEASNREPWEKNLFDRAEVWIKNVKKSLSKGK